MNINFKLSKNFSYSELVKSQTAQRFGIENWPDNHAMDSAKRLAHRVLQPIRDELGVVTVSSWYRSPKLNKKIGGSKNSQHMTAKAADIEVYSMDTLKLACWIQENIKDFDQMILECYNPGFKHSGWIHISYNNEVGNRKQVLTAVKRKNYFGRTKIEYLPGLNP